MTGQVIFGERLSGAQCSVEVREKRNFIREERSRLCDIRPGLQGLSICFYEDLFFRI